MTDAKNPAKLFWAYMALAFTITWAFCGLYWLTRSGAETGPGVGVRLGNLAAVWGPSVAGVVMAWTVGGRSNAISLTARLWRAPEHWRWIALAFAVPLGLQALGALVGDFITPYDFVEAAPQSLPPLLFGLFFSFISGPLGEELGWRGFGLHHGARAYGPVTATLIIGLAWSLWHLPAFVVPGLQDIIFPIGISFWEFSGFTMFGAVVLSWLTFNARGALAPAVIGHFSILTVVMMVDQTPPATLSMVTIALYAVAAAVILWRAPDLGYEKYLAGEEK